MNQTPLKLRQNQPDRFSVEEVDSNWQEIEARTKHNEDGYNSASELAARIKEISAPSITPDTGAIIRLDNPLGNECNMNNANTNTAFILIDIKAGGESTVLINTNTEPVISGSSVTKVFGHQFTPNVNMHLKVKCRIIGVVEYYFLKILA